MASLTSCPTPDVLECLLLGRLPAAEADQTEAHLEICPTCQRLAGVLPAEDELVQAMRGAAQPLLGPDDTPVVEVLCRWLTSNAESMAIPPASSRDSNHTQTFTGAGGALPQGLPDSSPEMLGRFRLLRQLGEGGMGVVWLAFDPRLGRQVALKVIHPRRAHNPEAASQFQAEARAMAALESDHIVPVYEVDEDHGSYYLAMPLLKGETLESRLKRTGKQPLAEVLRIGREIAQGLAAAHARDLIHRDVKPNNIWLEEPASRVKILDFGLSCMLTDVAGRSVPGGTPAYMAPEQAIGQPVDFRADLFSLGCVLYFLAAGVPPFVSSDYLATIVQVASVEPPPPRQVNPTVPPRLDQLIRRLLAKKPGERLASAAQVIQVLEEIENEAVSARRRRSRRRWLLAASLGLAAACGLTAYLTWYHVPPKVEKHIQVEEVAPKGKAIVELEPGDWSVVLSHDEEKYAIDRKEKGPLELPAGIYEARLSKARGLLRPWPCSFTVPENKEVTVAFRLVGEEAAYTGHPGPVKAVALAPHGLRNLSGGEGDLEIILWDPAGNKAEPLDQGIEKKHEAGVGCLAFSPDGKRAASGEAGKQKAFPQNGFSIWLWDLDRKTGERLGVMGNWVTALAFRPPRGEQLLVGDGDGRVRLWDLSRHEADDLGSHRNGQRVTSLSVSANGARAITGGWDQRVMVWDLEKQKRLRELQPAPARKVLSVALTADGRIAIAGCDNGLIHVWDLQTDKVRTLTGHKEGVNGVAVAADGSRLVSGGKDGTVRLWDLARGQEIEAFREQRPGEVLTVALSADGKYVLTGSRGGSPEGGRVRNAVRLWRLP